MTKNSSPWNTSNSLDGSTDSERYLVKLARKTFLSLWSYPNLYTDESLRNKGDGSELCDLLIIFGNDIILFSDKDNEFISHDDINIAWSRWYRRAIQKSVKQLKGAESWIKRFPERVFLDKECQIPLPVALPSITESRIHLVAVTRGAGKQTKSYWGSDSSGSLFIDTKLVGYRDHSKVPFRIGWPLSKKRFVHVLNEFSLDLLLSELDTVADFIQYLVKKEQLFFTEGLECILAGEEALLALYLSKFNYTLNEHYFPEIPKGGALLALVDGDWQRLIKSTLYASRSEANEISYTWDDLIEFHSHHIINGSVTSFESPNTLENHERVMRIMASENRITRRSLGEAFHVANNNKQREMRFTRTVVSASQEGTAYIFMSAFKPKELNLEDYLLKRRTDLLLYADECKLEYENISRVIGIVFEPGQKIFNSIDFLLVDFGKDPLPEDFINEIKPRLEDSKMWDKNAMKFSIKQNSPFPKIESPIYRAYIWLMHKIKKVFER